MADAPKTDGKYKLPGSLLRWIPMMSPAAVFLLSVSMSVDAFAVSVGRGVVLYRPRLKEAMRTGLVFGAVETLTPFLGWLAGVAANDWVADYDHWLAFILLSAVGLHMVQGAIRGGGKDRDRLADRSFIVLLATAFGTSLDAMAVGLSLAFIDVTLQGIILISLAIGCATFLMSTAGIMVGRAIGNRFGTFSEVAAGVVLCGLGALILFEHISA